MVEMSDGPGESRLCCTARLIANYCCSQSSVTLIDTSLTETEVALYLRQLDKPGVCVVSSPLVLARKLSNVGLHSSGELPRRV